MHIDGLRERHDASVDRDGVFDEAVDAIREAKERGFRVTTNSTFFNTDSPDDGARRPRLPERRARGRRDDDLARLRVREGARPGALPRGRGDAASCSATRSPTAAGRRWRLNHTPLFLDFLEGKVDFDCTAWAIPSYSVFGWQRPCYLMADGYAADLPGADRDHRLGPLRPWQATRCANCMAHCGYEPTAVFATMGSLRESLRAAASAR